MALYKLLTVVIFPMKEPLVWIRWVTGDVLMLFWKCKSQLQEQRESKCLKIFISPSPPWTLKCVVNLCLQYSPPPFLPVCGHCVPVWLFYMMRQNSILKLFIPFILIKLFIYKTNQMHIWYTQCYNINARMVHTILQYKCTYYTHSITI